jgi:hypothetical protein
MRREIDTMPCRFAETFTFAVRLTCFVLDDEDSGSCDSQCRRPSREMAVMRPNNGSLVLWAL